MTLSTSSEFIGFLRPLEITLPRLLSLPEGTLAEIWAKTDAIEAEIYRRSDYLLRDAFAMGRSRPLPQASGGCGLGGDLVRDRMASLIYATREERNVGKCWVVLDPESYPGIYELKDASVRLRKLAERTPGKH